MSDEYVPTSKEVLDGIYAQLGPIHKAGYDQAAAMKRFKQLKPGSDDYYYKRQPSPGAPAAVPALLPLIWARDTTAMLECDYVVKGLFDRGALVLVYGASQSGKTFFVLDIAMHVASDRHWRNRRVRQGLVIYIAAESGARVQRRVRAWLDEVSRATLDPALAIVPCVVNLMEDVAVERIMSLIEQVRASRTEPLAMIVIDTLARSLVGGDENSAEDMGHAISVADAVRDRVGAATVLIHHTGKDQEKGARGSSALFAAVDCSIYVRGNEGGRVAVIDKARDDPTGTGLFFKLKKVVLGTDTEGDEVSTCVVTHGEEGDAPRASAALPRHADFALRVLSGLLEGDEHLQLIDGQRAVLLSVWRAKLDEAYGDEVPTDATERQRLTTRNRQRFNRARNALVEMARVVVFGDSVRLNA